MNIVVPGGTGQIGRSLVPALRERGHEVTVLSRSARRSNPGAVPWDGISDGPWMSAVDGADAVINLAGRSVDCRYNKTNLTAMLASRIDSTRAVGRAIASASRPPRVWLQASTATIYAHSFDQENDEVAGRIGGHEPDVPSYWRFSIEIAKAWEREMREAEAPDTRRVALRTAIHLSPLPGSTFDLLRRIARLGLGGPIAGGRQYFSWIHHRDFARAIEFLLERDDVEGPVNLAAPVPAPYAEFMRELRRALGVPIGLPATAWMYEVAAWALRTDSELILKSRRVVPGRLRELGFAFEFHAWPEAARDLLAR